MPDLAPMRPMASHASTQPTADPNTLTDAELLAVFNDDDADLSLLTPEEQNRLVVLTEQPKAEVGVSIFGKKLPLPESVSRPIAAWGLAGPTRVKEGLSDVAEGNVSRGLHDVLAGGVTTALPMLAPRFGQALLKAPIATLTQTAAGATGGALVGSVAKGAARSLGADEDQATLAGDAGALVGGAAAVKTAQIAGEIAARIAGAVPAGARGHVAGEVVKGVASDLFPRTAKIVRRGASALEKAQASQSSPVAESAPVAPPVSSTPAAPPPAPTASVPPVVAASPAAPTPPPVRVLAGESLTIPASGRTPGQMSPASIGMDLGLSARRLGATLSKDQFAEAATLVTSRGLSPVQAVQQIAGQQAPAPPVATASAPAAARPSPRVSRAEAQEYARMLAAGKTDEEATQAILTQRSLIARTGATSPAKAQRRVAARQATGRWPSGTP